MSEAPEMVTARSLLLVNVDLYTREEGEGLPLIVLHGGPGLDHSVIAPHLAPLARHLRLISFDHRGTGRSAAPQGPDPYHIDRFAADLEALADVLEIGQFALLGHSFGGIVALHFALSHPELLTHLILVCTPVSHHFVQEVEAALPRKLDPGALAELASLQDNQPSSKLMRRTLDLLAPVYFHDPAKVSELGLDSVRFGPDSQAVWDSLEGFDLRPRLAEIDVPTLVVAGAEDHAVTVERARQAAELLPRGTLEVIKDSGHYPYIEDREAFLTAVSEFLGLKVGKKGLFGRRFS